MNANTCVKMILHTLLIIGSVTHLAHAASSNKLPSSFPLCKRKDPNLDDCLMKAARPSIQSLKGGVPSLNIPPLDPLQIPGIEIGQGQGPISINQKFTNILVYGLSDANLQKSMADLDNYNLTFQGVIENVVFEADYEMSGRILLLPVTGKGRCKMIFTNIRSFLGPRAKATVKKGITYFDITDFYLDIYDLDNHNVQFDNLFNGDKTLGESMNRLMNENWKDLWKELKPAFDQSFGAVFKHYSKTIFDKVAFNDIFIE